MADEVGAPIIVRDAKTGAASQMEFTNSFLNGRRLIRAQKNPMDRCTIVSIFPQDIEEVKHTIEPGHFNIKAGKYDNPSILVIGSSSWWKDIDVDQPMLEMQRSSIEVANAVITDYCNSMLASNMGDTMPGLFFVLGEHTVAEIKMKYKTKLDEVKVKQDNWFRILVRIADSLWARTNGNPLVIWDVMRLAARELNLNDKIWLKDFQAAALVPCKACGSMRNPLFPICPSCKSIDATHPEAKNLKFAV
jgi:hypothetical protein